jgi:hypothetical protein
VINSPEIGRHKVFFNLYDCRYQRLGLVRREITHILYVPARHYEDMPRRHRIAIPDSHK